MEVLQLADLLGFDVDYNSRKSIDSLYADQPDTLLKFTYGKHSPVLFSSWRGVRMIADNMGSYAILDSDKEGLKWIHFVASRFGDRDFRDYIGN